MASMVPVGDETPVEVLILTFWDKVIIASGAAAFLLLVAICMVCLLCPRCLMHGMCFGDEDEKADEKPKKKKLGSQRSTSSKSSSRSSKSSKSGYGSTESDYYYGLPPGTEVGPLAWKPLDIVKENITGMSDGSDTGSGFDVIHLDKHSKLTSPDHGLSNGDVRDVTERLMERGSIEFRLNYLLSEEKLVINIGEVRDIQLVEGKSLVSPYVKIRLYRSPKQFFTFGGKPGKDYVINNLDKELKTKIQRASEVLVYKETFEVIVDGENLRNYTIRFMLCDMDRLSRHVVLGETSLSLQKIELQNVAEMTFIEELHPPVEEDLGTMSVGLSYLPTSEKLYLTVENIKGLKAMDKKTKTTDPCVKVFLMHEGKQLKRVKTTVRAASLSPVFNESFSFDVPHNELERIYFSLVACHYEKDRKGSRLIGRVYLGQRFDLHAQEHWISMMQNPRKKIVSPYKLVN